MAEGVRFVYEVPFLARKELCRLLDVNEEWKELAGRMEFAAFDVLEIESESRRRASSPTDMLLSLWGQSNHTVLELFVLLARMSHSSAMSCLRNFVDARYHCLIDQQSTSADTDSRNMMSTQSQLQTSDNNETSGIPVPLQNVEQEARAPSCIKILNQPPITNVANEAKISSASSNNTVCESAGGLLNIPYSELSGATQNWNEDNILGKGGFGVVYKGTWKNTAVAIKRLKMSGINSGVTDEILRELRYLNSFRHDNILPLYGYSVGGKDSCLVYQLMIGGSLEERLRCKNRQQPLSWSQRLSIAQGVAKGLQFLHTVSNKPLIHGDIKSANILLDVCGAPRIGDFGLAREGPNSEELTHIKVSRVHGTEPYLPHEFLRSREFSVKVDVYSFGVVIFELVTGECCFDKRRKYPFLKDHIIARCNENPTDLDELQDAKLVRINELNSDLCRKLIIIGVKCVQSLPSERPNMVEVWKELVTIPPPEKSF